MEILSNSKHCVSIVDLKTMEFRDKNRQNKMDFYYANETGFIDLCGLVKPMQIGFFSDSEPEFRIYTENLSFSPIHVKVELVHKNGESLQIGMGVNAADLRNRGFISKEALETWCHNDGSLLYRVTFDHEIMESLLTALLGVYNHTEKHCDKLEKVFVTGCSSDVTFVVGDQEISAARIFLVSGSYVFAAMFENEWKDAKNGRILIEDVDYEVLHELIKFMYSGKCMIKNYEFALNLYQVAEKYNVLDVKVDAKEYICARLSQGNVIRAMLLADLNDDEEIMTTAVDYVVQKTTLKVNCLPHYEQLNRKLVSRLLIKMWEVFK